GVEQRGDVPLFRVEVRLEVDVDLRPRFGGCAVLQVVEEDDRVGGPTVLDVDPPAAVPGRVDEDVAEVVEPSPDNIVGAVDRRVDADVEAGDAHVVVGGVRGHVVAGEPGAAGAGEVAEEGHVHEIGPVRVRGEDPRAVGGERGETGDDVGVAR